MNTRVMPITNPVKLLIVRQKDLNDRKKGYEVLDGKNWKDLLHKDSGTLFTPTEIIALARKTERHIFWNPITRRRQDSSIFVRAEKLETA